MGVCMHTLQGLLRGSEDQCDVNLETAPGNSGPLGILEDPPDCLCRLS